MQRTLPQRSLLRALAWLLPLCLLACGGGGDADEVEAAAEAAEPLALAASGSASLEGTVGAGPASGSLVTVHALDRHGAVAGAVLAQGKTDEHGRYLLRYVPPSHGRVLVSASGGTYSNPVDRKPARLGNLSAVVQGAAGRRPAHLHPLSHFEATRARTLMRAGKSFDAAQAAATASVLRVLPLKGWDRDDPLSQLKPDFLAMQGSGHELGVALAVIEQLARSARTSGPKVVQALASDLADGTPDGANAGAAVRIEAEQVSPALASGALARAATAYAANRRSLHRANRVPVAATVERIRAAAARVCDSDAQPCDIVFGADPQRSSIRVAAAKVPPHPRVQDVEWTFMAPRGYVMADLDGDGLDDILAAPHFGNHYPALPIRIWLNQGDGSFVDGTASVIDGKIPTTLGVSELLVGDFNEDGRPDFLFVGTGPDTAVVDGDARQGAPVLFLLSGPDGRLRDASARIPNNAAQFNHQAGMGDVDGDGHLDFVVNKQGTQYEPKVGLALYLGDGRGNFTDATNLLPPEVRLRPQFPGPGPGDDWPFLGCAGIGDLDGDGVAEILAGSYSANDPVGKTRTVRVFRRLADGRFAERTRAAIPAPIARISHAGVLLGCSHITVGDLHGKGRNDVVVQWEGTGDWYIHLLRNDGDFRLADVTLAAIGRYATGYGEGNRRMGPGKHHLRDIDGDGRLDIVNAIGGSDPDTTMLRHLALRNAGGGRFTPWIPRLPAGPLTGARLAKLMDCEGKACSFIPLVFDSTGSGVASLVLVEFRTSTDFSIRPAQTRRIDLHVFEPLRP